ncbi:MAG TPA: DUF4136 domain-containing protein [Steroidobacteraceae bacterium]
MISRNAPTMTRWATLLGLGLLLASCATRYDIRSQSALNANLTSYHTYAFMAKPGTDKDGYKTITTQNLERAVNREMYVRGYTPAAVGSEPDLVINFNVKEKDKVQGDGPGFGYGVGFGYGPHWGYGYGLGLDDYYNGIQTVTEGSLVIDLIDRVRNEVVWSGTAVGQITKKSLDHPDETIDRSVAEIFARYPIKPR